MRLRWWLAALALIQAANAPAAWQQASSQHFLVYSDDDPAKVRAFTTKLERFDKMLRVTRGMAEEPISPMARVTVFVVRDIDAVRRLAHLSSDVAGFYEPRASGPVAFVPRRGEDDDEKWGLGALPILLHEYAHHFMYATSGEFTYPAWFVEGFAEFNATTRFEDDGGVLVGSAPGYRAYGILSGTMPVKRLLVTDPNALKSPEDRQVFYGRAWLLTHYLSLDDQRRATLTRYLKAVNDGDKDAAAILGDPGALDRALDKYVMQSKLAGLHVKSSILAVNEVGVRALSPAETAMMPALIASKRGVDAKSAPGVAVLARKLAAPFPNDAAAQNELAEAEVDAKHFAQAGAAAERALAADPHSVHAMIYRGLALLGAGSKDATVDPATAKQARGWFSKANHVDPEYAWPLQLFYQSFRASGTMPNANAEAGLIYAHALAPFDDGLSMTAAYILLQQGKVAEATAALKPVAYNPHGGDAAGAASAVLAVMAKEGAPAALAAMDGALKKDAGRGADAPGS